jgi:tRNA U34 5-carboxymethylaminomethyl modifying enzyme MnmG/GidA
MIHRQVLGNQADKKVYRNAMKHALLKRQNLPLELRRNAVTNAAYEQ